MGFQPAECGLPYRRTDISAGCQRLQKMHAPVTSGKYWTQEAGALICSCLFILGIAAAQAAERPQKLRAGSGMRQDDIKMQHLTHKAVCSQDFLGQTPLFKGEWIPHKDPEFKGYYEESSECPEWAGGYDCRRDATDNKEKLPREYNEIFRPFVCDMRPWDTQDFLQCTSKRRMILIGDMSMHQLFNSLACLLGKAITAGSQTPWEDSGLLEGRSYTGRALTEGDTVKRRYVGQFLLHNGLEVYLRSFNVFNLTLWDDIMAHFGELTEQDILVVNFGAWYPRYSVLDPHHPWPAWQTDMKELINERLSTYRATTFWRSYSAAHYGGTNGTNTFEEETAKALKESGECPATRQGESWYEEYVRAYLRKCGDTCRHIHLLPVFQLTVGKHGSHLGSFGHGKDGQYLDCRLFCNNVVDQWAVLLYNYLC